MALSKSLFIRGYQCIKSYYLHKKRPYLRDPISTDTVNRFKRGHEFDKIIHRIFPGGQYVWKGGNPASKKIQQKLQQILSEKPTILYQIPFYVNDLLAIADIAINEENKWFIYEVKSSTVLKEVFFMDLTFQAHVIELYGISSAFYRLLFLKHCWEEIKETFSNDDVIILDVDSEITERKSAVKNLIEVLREVDKMDHSPQIEVGKHCLEPYQCDFIGHCWHKRIEEVKEILEGK